MGSAVALPQLETAIEDAECYNWFGVYDAYQINFEDRGCHMPKNRPAQGNLSLPFTLGANFLRDHAGHIISDTRVAITELIANAYDAGATSVVGADSIPSWPRLGPDHRTVPRLHSADFIGRER